MNVRLYLGSTESIKQFLRNSSTMGSISLQAMLKELREGEFKIIDINGLQIKRHFCLCVLRDRRKLRLPILSVLYKAYLKSRKAAGDIIGKMMVWHPFSLDAGQ